MKNSILFSLIIAGFTFYSCTKIDKSKDDLTFYGTLDMESRVLNFETTKKEGGAHSGKYYSSVDSINRFAVGYSFVIPDSLKSKKLTIMVSAWLREPEAPIQGGIAFSLSNSKGLVVWNEVNPKNKTAYKPNEWIFFSDSMSFSSDMIKDSFSEIGVVGIKTYGKDRLDIDDFQVKYKFSK